MNSNQSRNYKNLKKAQAHKIPGIMDFEMVLLYSLEQNFDHSEIIDIFPIFPFPDIFPEIAFDTLHF